MTSVAKVVAVIPAYNEGKTVARVVRDLKAVVDEVVVVNDCSKDNTRTEAEDAGAVVVNHEVNGGYDKTIDDGFKKAAELGADIIFTFDADGEHDVADVERIVGPIVRGEADIVLGQRPHTTHWAEKIYMFYTRMRYGITDPLCGFKAYRRSVYDAVGYFDTVQSIGTQLTLEGLRKGFRLALVPIALHARVDDTSRFYARNFRANIKILKVMLRTIL